MAIGLLVPNEAARAPGLPTLGRVIFCLIFLGAFLLAPGPGGPGSDARAAEPLTLVVHPYLPKFEVKARFTPLARYIKAHAGREVRVIVSESYEAHITSIGMGKADIGYLGPVSYVELVQKYGPQKILVRQADKGKPVFRGVIIARQDSDIKKLSQLKGKRFAFGAKASTMSHVIPEVMLHEAGVDVGDLASFDFVGGHKEVALSVLTGKFDAGGVKEEVFLDYGGRGLKALAHSAPMSEHIFVVRGTLDAALRAKLKKIMLTADADQQGLAALKSIKGTLSAFVAAGDMDYDPLRRTMLTFSTLQANVK